MTSKSFKTASIKSQSMKNLSNPAASFIVPMDFGSFGKECSNIFDDPHQNEQEKIRIVRQSLHRYIFIICHTIQHFGHQLTSNEIILVENACEKTLQWMWHCETKSLLDFRQHIIQLLRICTPLMKRLFRNEQQCIINSGRQ